ncbi:MAG: hypothetical protein LDL11_08380 [Desulfarculus sp.]|nr:hypothetical protein [Desulfarculus sp.]
MWQTVLAVVIVAVAAYFVGRRFWWGVSGQGPACGCGPDKTGGCSTCARPQRLTLEDLTPPPGESCPHCPPEDDARRADPESEEKR